MSSDYKGHYANLGVSPDASLDEIKAVYRALVKIYHPDVNKDRAALEKFKALTAAYEVLSDPRRRSEYDRAGQVPPQSEPPPHSASPSPPPRAHTNPVLCSKCGKATAQPRFLAFREVRGYILVEQTITRRGVYCSDCAAREAWTSSRNSALFGWWGFPWGPLLTVKEILRNAFGGERFREVEEELNWQNAVAFWEQGRNDLALSLSRPLQRAKSADIARAANKLTELLQSNGAKANSLKSNWRPRLASVFGQLAMGSVVPIVAAVVISQAWATKSDDVGFPTYTPAASSPPPRTAVSKPAPPPRPAIAQSECAVPPVNNQLLGGRTLPNDEGHQVTVRNGSSGDAIVKLRDAWTRRVAASFFVEKGQTATVDGIPDGRYRIQFAYGDALDASCKGFIDPHASEFDSIETLATQRRADGIYTSVLSLTLYTVAGGNARISGINASAFTD